MITVRSSQIRAGRALLGWSIADLSDASGVAPATIQRAEKSAGEPQINVDKLAVIITTLRENGVHMVKDMSRYGVMFDTRGGGK